MGYISFKQFSPIMTIQSKEKCGRMDTSKHIVSLSLYSLGIILKRHGRSEAGGGGGGGTLWRDREVSLRAEWS